MSVAAVDSTSCNQRPVAAIVDHQRLNSIGL